MAMKESDKRLIRQTVRNIKVAKDSLGVLCIDAGASHDDVRTAFKDIALYLHPDKAARAGVSAEDATACMKRLNNARDELLSGKRPAPQAKQPAARAGPVQPPKGLRVKSVVAGAVEVSWSGKGPFELGWRKAGDTTWTAKPVSSSAARKRNLDAGETYLFRVRVAGKAPSDWSREVSTRVSGAARAPPKTPQKTPRKRAAAGQSPTPKKRARGSGAVGLLTLRGAKVTLVRRTPFDGGHRAAFRLEQEDARFAGTRNVVMFDRSGSTGFVSGDFGQGAVWALGGHVKASDFNGSPQIMLQDDGLFSLRRTADQWRSCPDCGEECISTDEPAWKKQCTDCWRASQ